MRAKDLHRIPPGLTLGATGPRTASVVVLALLLLPAWPLVPRASAYNGSGAGPGLTIERTMLVSGQPATAVESLPDGTLLVGLEGGGVLEMNETGTVLALGTTVNGLPSSHVRDLAVWQGKVWAATRGGLAVREGPGNWTIPPGGRIGNAISVKGCEDGLLLLLWDGSLSWTADGESWIALEPTGQYLNSGWRLADREGEWLVLSNGTGIVIWNFTSGLMIPLTVPGGPTAQNVTDLDLAGGTVWLATEDHLDAFEITRLSWWLGPEVADTAREIDDNWTCIHAGPRVLAGSRAGIVVELTGEGAAQSWELVYQGLASSPGAIADILPWDDGGAFIASGTGVTRLTASTSEVFTDAATSAPRSSDMAYVESVDDMLFTVRKDANAGELEFLAFDVSGTPFRWDAFRSSNGQGQPGPGTRLLDSALHESVVYLATGSSLVTYDTFASSKPSRWNVTLGQGNDDAMVRAVEACSGRLYAGGQSGLKVMGRDGNDITWTTVRGVSYGEVLDLADHNSTLLMATTTGLWAYDPATGHATPPEESWVPWAPVNQVVVSGGVAFAAVGRTIYWQDADGTRHNRTFEGVGGFDDLVGSADRAGPVWGVLNGAAVAFDPAGGETWFGAAAEDRAGAASAKLGDAVIRDVTLDAEGIACLATDSGVHRVEPFGTAWTTLTTSEGLSANDLRTLEADPVGGNLWVGAYGGIDVIDVATGGIEGVGTEEGLPSNLVYDILIHQGEAWVGTDVGGAARRALAGGAWTVYNKTTGLVEDDVQAVAVIGTKAVFGTDAGVSVLDLVTSSISTHTMSSTGGQLPSDWVWCLLATGGRVWAGANGGLASYDPQTDTWTREMREELGERAVKALLATPDGGLWVGTDTGLFILDTTTGASREVPSMARSGALSLLLDSQGQVWAGTGDGAILLDAGGLPIAHFTTRDGLVHGRVTCLAELPGGTIWLGTAGGLSRLERTRWNVLPQMVSSGVALPELHIDDSGVSVSPMEPYEGDTVLVTVRVENPSPLRVIGTVVLSTTPSCVVGQELASAIAYTEPGGSYTVALCWTATRGQHALWVIVDPLDRVPEVNERDNVVALGLYVNSRPELRDLVATLDHVEGAPGAANGTWTVEVVYSDADGDPPIKVYASEAPAREDVTLSPVSGSGDLYNGQTYRGTVTLMSGTRELVVTAEYAPGRSSSISTTVALNLNINLTGVSPGETLKGVVKVTVQVVGPWEGTKIESLTVSLNRTAPPLVVSVPSQRDGMVLTFDVSREGIEPGIYDIIVEAHDDRGMVALGVVEGVNIAAAEEDRDSYIWVILLAIMLVLLTMAAFAMKTYKKDGPQ